MYISTFKKWKEDKKYFHNLFNIAIEFLKTLDPEKSIPGKYYIKGEDIFAKIECGIGKEEDKRLFELHNKYIDIQMLLLGDERQDVTLFPPSTPPIEDKLQNEDIAFYSVSESIISFSMLPEMFIIYFPGELHAPGVFIGKGKYKKVVVKIAKNLIK